MKTCRLRVDRSIISLTFPFFLEQEKSVNKTRDLPGEFPTLPLFEGGWQLLLPTVDLETVGKRLGPLTGTVVLWTVSCSLSWLKRGPTCCLWPFASFGQSGPTSLLPECEEGGGAVEWLPQNFREEEAPLLEGALPLDPEPRWKWPPRPDLGVWENCFPSLLLKGWDFGPVVFFWSDLGLWIWEEEFWDLAWWDCLVY